MTLNGVKLTDSVFKRHCYVMKQHDKHWPYLTCRETLTYCAELFHVAAKQDIPTVVEELIQKMGLSICVDTRCGRLSGGQQRRLSIGIALLKQVSYCSKAIPLFIVQLAMPHTRVQPTLLFLDEPTSGEDGDVWLWYLTSFDYISICRQCPCTNRSRCCCCGEHHERNRSSCKGM